MTAKDATHATVSAFGGERLHAEDYVFIDRCRAGSVDMLEFVKPVDQEYLLGEFYIAVAKKVYTDADKIAMADRVLQVREQMERMAQSEMVKRRDEA